MHFWGLRRTSQVQHNCDMAIAVWRTRFMVQKDMLHRVFKVWLHILGEHNGVKTVLYPTNAKSQVLVPAYFALIIIIVVHVVKHQSVLINKSRRQESLRLMLCSSSI